MQMTDGAQKADKSKSMHSSSNQIDDHSGLEPIFYHVRTPFSLSLSWSIQFTEEPNEGQKNDDVPAGWSLN